MEKTRVKKGEKYWRVGFYPWGIIVTEDIDTDDTYARQNFNDGNYFHTKEEAEVMAEKLRAVLNGAEVIEDLTESDIIKAKSDFDAFAKYLDEKGIGYKNIKEAKAAFLVGIQWRNSKIVK